MATVLERIRNIALGVPDSASDTTLAEEIYLQQIRDAILGVPSTQYGNLHSGIYLQQIRNAILGVPDGQFGSLDEAIYLQQIRNAILGVPDGQFGSLDVGIYWDEILDAALVMGLGGGTTIPWYLSGGISAADCLIAYQPIGAASLATSYINLANPGTNNAAPGTAPTFNTNDGWTFNGSNQYLTTGLAPVAGESIIVRYSTASSLMILCHDGVNFYGFEKDTSKVYYEKGGFVLSSVIPVAGVLAIASNKGYIDGVVDKTIGAGTGLPTTRELTIGARNANGTINGWTAFKVQAFARYKIDITSQLPALVAAINALP